MSKVVKRLEFMKWSLFNQEFKCETDNGPKMISKWMVDAFVSSVCQHQAQQSSLIQYAGRLVPILILSLIGVVGTEEALVRGGRRGGRSKRGSPQLNSKA